MGFSNAGQNDPISGNHRRKLPLNSPEKRRLDCGMGAGQTQGGPEEGHQGPVPQVW